MTRLRFSLALLLFTSLPVGVHAQGMRYFEEIDKSFDDEINQRTAAVMKYCDANGDGVLTHPESATAVTQVVEAMTDRLPQSSYISGGEPMVRKMRKVISQQPLDRNADRQVDPTELGTFIGFAIAQSETTLRTPYKAQYAITMDETAKNTMRYTWALERERRIRDNWKWHNLGIQQQKETYFEVHARKRAQWARDQFEIAKSRERADREALLRESSPGLLPKETDKQAPPAEQPK